MFVPGNCIFYSLVHHFVRGYLLTMNALAAQSLCQSNDNRNHSRPLLPMNIKKCQIKNMQKIACKIVNPDASTIIFYTTWFLKIVSFGPNSGQTHPTAAGHALVETQTNISEDLFFMLFNQISSLSIFENRAQFGLHDHANSLLVLKIETCHNFMENHNGVFHVFHVNIIS